MFDVFLETIQGIWRTSGLAAMTWQQWVMIGISFVLVYLAVVKGFEPLLLLPIAFGMFLTNLPMTEMFHMKFFTEEKMCIRDSLLSIRILSVVEMYQRHDWGGRQLRPPCLLYTSRCV